MNNIEKLIKEHIKPIPAKYKRANEKAINPAYENLTQGYHCPLAIDDFRIFVLTESFNFNTGIKNNYNDSLKMGIDKSLHKYINWDDQYGHPSISNEENIYYAGYLHQKNGYIEVFLCSGRYSNPSLQSHHTYLLQSYV